MLRFFKYFIVLLFPLSVFAENDSSTIAKMSAFFHPHLALSDSIKRGAFVSFGASPGFIMDNYVFTGVVSRLKAGAYQRMNWRSSTSLYLFADPARVRFNDGLANALEAGVASEGMFYFLKWGRGTGALKFYGTDQFPRYEHYQLAFKFMAGVNISPFKRLGFDYEYSQSFLEDTPIRWYHPFFAVGLTGGFPTIGFFSDKLGTKETMRSPAFFFPVVFKTVEAGLTVLFWQLFSEGIEPWTGVTKIDKHMISVVYYF